jgi:thiol-disulfide isomerase/thioredoxin
VNPRRAAIAAALITVLAVVGAVAALSVNREKVLPAVSTSLLAADKAPVAPELAGISHFDNTPPLTMEGLRGRVVLVDFWTYTCINCRRTFPFLRALQKTYPELTIVGVHSPEFGFEKVHDNVARAVKELDVTWPVAEDPEMVTWRAYSNQYWPGDYLVDRQGRVRYFHAGEGNEDEIENAIRALLNEGGTAPAARIGQPTATEQPGNDLTPETYFGADRGERYIAGSVVVPAGKTVVRKDPAQQRDLLRLTGSFTGGPEYLELGAGAAITQVFHARDVYATTTPADAPVVLDVTLDGKPVPVGRRGSSLTEVGGRTVATLKADDLLHLITGSALGDGTLQLTAQTAGARFFTFTYGA